MIGIVFTTSDLATAFLNAYGEGRFDAVEEGTPVQTDHLLVAVTGPGKIKSALAAERLLRTHDLRMLIHTGTCTALDDTIDVGTLVGGTAVLEGDRVELDSPTYPRMPLSLPFAAPSEGIFVSRDHSADASEERGYWERLADVCDETSYAVAFVAAQHGTPCHVAKVVTDLSGASPDSSSLSTEDACEQLVPFLQQVAEDERPE